MTRDEPWLCCVHDICGDWRRDLCVQLSKDVCAGGVFKGGRGGNWPRRAVSGRPLTIYCWVWMQGAMARATTLEQSVNAVHAAVLQRVQQEHTDFKVRYLGALASPSCHLLSCCGTQQSATEAPPVTL